MKLDRGILAALGAATLFGLSTPIAKTLVGEISPLLLAGLLYSGSGVGLTILCRSRERTGTSEHHSAAWRRLDVVARRHRLRRRSRSVPAHVWAATD
jgi:drug/metabolite transporter (DMT)-like permease